MTDGYSPHYFYLDFVAYMIDYKLSEKTKNMKYLQNKKLVTTALTLILTLSMLMASMTLIYGQGTQTYFYVMVAPNPVGVNQYVLVTLQLDELLSNAQGFRCDAEAPNGTTIHLFGPATANPVAAQWFSFTPDAVGNWTLTGTWSGSGTYRASTGTTTLVVQEEPIPYYPDVPLPTDSFKRPIYGENKNWWKVADNWLMFSYDRTDIPDRRQSCYALYTSGPDSAHILWTRPLQFGGIVGGRLGDNIYYTGNSYEQHYFPIIIQGRIIYTEDSPDGSTSYGTRCIDLYTGEDIWYLDRTDLAFAQTVLINNVNEHGVLPYLWFGSGSSYTIYDPFTAEQLFTFTNFPSGTTTIGPNGEILVYSLSGTTLTMWNSTRAMGATTGSSFTPRGTISGSSGTEWTTTLQGSSGRLVLINPEEGLVLTGPSGGMTGISAGTYRSYAIPPNSGRPSSTTPMLSSSQVSGVGSELRLSANIGNGTFAVFDAGPNDFTIYNMTTGAVIRKTAPLESGWAFFTYVFHIAYGKMVSIGYDGYIHGYDVTKDSTEDDWHYYLGTSGFENAYGSYPTWNGMTIADGKVYVCADEHSQDAIPWRGGNLWVVDIATGELVWDISGWLKVPVISDGIATAVNALDMQIYTFGKGPSKTTISAPDVVAPFGSSIMITGTVTDQTPSSKDTPAISDESMTAWMEYLYEQKPYPDDATGVDVILEVTDSNNNTRIIGTTKTDKTGAYGFMYTPEIPGNFSVTAYFTGTKSYDMSLATTYFSISEKGQNVDVNFPAYGSAEWPAYPDVNAVTTTDMVIIAAVVAAIVIGVLNLVLMLRKRK